MSLMKATIPKKKQKSEKTFLDIGLNIESTTK